MFLETSEATYDAIRFYVPPESSNEEKVSTGCMLFGFSAQSKLSPGLLKYHCRRFGLAIRTIFRARYKNQQLTQFILQNSPVLKGLGGFGNCLADAPILPVGADSFLHIAASNQNSFHARRKKVSQFVYMYSKHCPSQSYRRPRSSRFHLRNNQLTRY